MQEKKPDNTMTYMPIGMCIGLSVGMAIGAAFKHISIGMCIGLSVGMAIGAIIDTQNRKKTTDDPEDKPEEKE